MSKRRTHAARSAAASKGWRTRRANQRERSERAQRGWITRRRNEKKQARLKAKSKPATRVAVKPKKPAKQIAGQLPSPGQVYEWLVSFTYKRSGRTLDVIATAYTENEAVKYALEFLRKKKYNHVANAIERGDKGWEMQVSKGNATRRRAGRVQFRMES